MMNFTNCDAAMEEHIARSFSLDWSIPRSGRMDQSDWLGALWASGCKDSGICGRVKIVVDVSGSEYPL